ncbi:MAG: hypothetical protein AAB316_22810 [Bacteroidota bacterium]
MEEIKTIEQLSIAVEDAMHRLIFKYAWLASEQAQQEAFAKGLSIVVLEGNQIVEIAPDGSKKVLKTVERQLVTLPSNKFTLRKG